MSNLRVPKIVDDVNDILALFIGVSVTGALIAITFIVPDLRELALGALVANLATVIQHFFGKGDAGKGVGGSNTG